MTFLEPETIFCGIITIGAVIVMFVFLWAV